MSRIAVNWLVVGLCCGALLVAGEKGPLLWRNPGPIVSLDLAGGPGGKAGAPRAPFTFVKEEAGGTSAKVVVRDARGVSWMAKFGEEVKAESFASRIVWAAGYYAGPTYFVREGYMQEAANLKRAALFIDAKNRGHFQNARFERFFDKTTYAIPGSKWTLNEPGLKGTHELGGLKLLFVLLSDWDVKPQNMAILQTRNGPMYAVTDWGATMGRAADVTGRSKWNCKEYTADTGHLVDEVANGFVTFNYEGKDTAEVLREIRLEDVQWLMQRLGKLSDRQIRSALTASGATPEEAGCFGEAFRRRLNEFHAISQSPGQMVTRVRRATRTTVKPKP